MRTKILLALLMILAPLPALAKLRVVATTPDLAALATEVGGDLIEVKSMARGDQDPHFLEPKPSYAVMLSRADLLLAVGLELESGWLPVLVNQARNPKIRPGQPGYLEPTADIRILEIPHGHVDRSMGDVHPSGNPHYWLNPNNGLRIAVAIADRLANLDPANKRTYLANLKGFEERLKAKIAVWQGALAPFRGMPIVTHHKSFSYFTEWAGLEVIALVEPKPGIPPSPSHLLKVIEAVKSRQAPLILSENYYDPKPAREIAAKAGAKALILPTSVGGSPGAATYLGLFDALVAALGGSR